MLAPISTGHSARLCKICSTPFVGLGILCPAHLAQHARARAFQIDYARAHSLQIITAREIATRKPRTEILDVLDMEVAA